MQGSDSSRFSIDRPAKKSSSGSWEQVRRSKRPEERVEEILARLDPRVALPDSPLYASLLQRFGNAKSLLDGKKVHAHLARFGHDRDTFLGNHLVSMYGKCGDLESARGAFEKIRDRNIFSWNILLAAHAQTGKLPHARSLFEAMIDKNTVSWNTIIAACAQHGEIREAKALFDRMPDRNVISWNSLVAGYAANGHLFLARELFETMPRRNIQSWNAIVSAYAQAGLGADALSLFDRLLRECPRIDPNDVSFIAALDACCDPESLDRGRKIHTMVAASEFRDDPRVKNALLAMYGRCRDLDNARIVFDGIPARDRCVVAWNTMIGAYARAGRARDAVTLFKAMDLEGDRPDAITWVAVLDACAGLSSTSSCRAIHSSLRGSGFESHLAVETSIVDMYAKSGSLASARAVFEGMARRDVWAWTAIIAGHARNGCGGLALELFRRFGLDGVAAPDSVTFLTILSACSHAGLLRDGLEFFLALAGDYGVPVSIDHYLCLIDLLGRAGQLEMAEQLILGIPGVASHAVAWITLLGACKLHGDEERGERVAKCASAIKPEISSPYVYRSFFFGKHSGFFENSKE